MSMASIQERLSKNAVAVQLPIGADSTFSGLVDLIEEKAFKFEGQHGENIVEIPIPDECDRVLALISRNVGDVIWGLTALPEVLGEVNDETLTHGFVVGKMGSLNQLLMSPPKGFFH